MQVRAARAKTSAAAIAASIAAEGYDSDEEVYATAKALEGEGEEGQDDDIAAKVGARLVFGVCKTASFSPAERQAECPTAYRGGGGATHSGEQRVLDSPLVPCTNSSQEKHCQCPSGFLCILGFAITMHSHGT